MYTPIARKYVFDSPSKFGYSAQTLFASEDTIRVYFRSEHVRTFIKENALPANWNLDIKQIVLLEHKLRNTSLLLNFVHRININSETCCVRKHSCINWRKINFLISWKLTE